MKAWNHKQSDLMWIHLHIILLCCYTSTLSMESIGCRDEQGRPVDWFVAYKLPRNESSVIPFVKRGVAHFYLDERNSHWRYSPVSVEDRRTAVGYTLQQIYDNAKAKDVAYVLYNDEHPDGGKSEGYGHTKGSLSYNSVSGFWLVHSLPKFPNIAKKGYSWPKNGYYMGQTFLCITFNASWFNVIGRQLTYNFPWIYDYNVPAPLLNQSAYIQQAIKGKHVNAPPWNNSIEMKSLGGQQFTSFAKYKKFDKDLYDAWLAPYFKSNMAAETWQDGPGKLDSYCGQFRVTNIQQVNVSDEKMSVLFHETRDHAKWAITHGSVKQWTCIGDINRQAHQMKRAGGTVCFQIAAVWNSFARIIAKVKKFPNHAVRYRWR